MNNEDWWAVALGIWVAVVILVLILGGVVIVGRECLAP